LEANPETNAAVAPEEALSSIRKHSLFYAVATSKAWRLFVIIVFLSPLYCTNVCRHCQGLDQIRWQDHHQTHTLTPEEKEMQLFKLVSLLTAWKNLLKGAGHTFWGSALLQVSYELPYK
jgi:polyferredoxin